MEPIKYDTQEFGVDVKVDGITQKLAYQRPVVPSRLRKLTQRFDPAMMGEILAVREDDGSLTVLDGQHRVELAKALGQPSVKAEVLTGVSDADRGRLFLGRNDRTNVARIHRDRARATVGDEETLAIDAACKAAGFAFITDEAHQSTFRDAEAAAVIMRTGERSKAHPELTGPQHLQHVLALYADIYGNDERPDSLILKGLSMLLLSRQDSEVDEERLGRSLQGIPPAQLVLSARALHAELARSEEMGITRATKRLIADQYNRGLPADSPKRLRH